MNQILAKVIAGAVLLLALAAGSYWWGDHNRNNAWLANQAKSALKAQEKFDAEVTRGNDAVAALEQDRDALKTNYSDLERKFHDPRNRVPLVVGSSNVCPGGDAVTVDVQAVASPSTQASGDGEAARTADPGPVLTYRAIWMWNSALAGADVPSGTCGSADTSTGACAAASGLTLQDAWDNHDTNARSCADDRLRYQHLIDFLKGKPH